ncbi:MAG: nucleotidyl transferase AbiEii/AbiGii toxin family protein [Candidatus Thermoplasmatota archaeon]|nr:nucleotidyl transferase AbiEii/AbiGii toxin family protein [Candidatus Thermoplasmatota archaeon]
MPIFEKWAWIKRNWLYVVEEATKLNLVFVGGTALNLALFNEYRASEDIDLYDPSQKTIGPANQAERIGNLAENLAKKGFEIKSRNQRAIFVGPNIKIEVFNDGTPFTTIEKKKIQETKVLVFDTNLCENEKYCAVLQI